MLGHDALDDLLDAVRHVFSRAGVLEKDDELVAADAHDKIRRTYALFERFSEVLEHFVAHHVAERVVDVLEVVKVKKQKSVSPARSNQMLVDALDARTAVEA